MVQKLTESRFGIPKFGIPIEIRETINRDRLYTCGLLKWVVVKYSWRPLPSVGMSQAPLHDRRKDCWREGERGSGAGEHDDRGRQHNVLSSGARAISSRLSTAAAGHAAPPRCTTRQSPALAVHGAGMAAHPCRRFGTLRGRMHVFPGGRMATWGVAAACAALLLVSLKGMEAAEVGNMHSISPAHALRLYDAVWPL
jgi:hypothetical protein